MLTLSDAEREFIQGGIDQDVRSDGRGNLNSRSLILETGVVSQASGSARVKLSTTDILAEIADVKVDRPNEGFLVCMVECSAIASQDFEGRGADELNNELSRLMEKMLTETASLDLKSLCIIPGLQCWALYIDALVLDFGGNLFDAIMIGVRAALFNTRLPTVTVLEDGVGNKEIEISDDSEDVKTLDVSNVPIAVTLHRVKKKYIVDPTLQEEQCSEARVVVGVNKAGKVCMVQKAGGGTINPSTLTDMIQSAKKIGLSLVTKLDEMLVKEQDLGQAKQGFFV